ncbi:MAG: CatA-like O-acetyltransferase [Acholeplasmataceae bacterium]
MKKINLDTWERKAHYLFFKQLDVPQYDITFQIEITPLYHFVKKEGISFYLTMVHTVMKTINQIEAFKYRIIGDDVMYFDVTHPSFTDVMAGSHLFKMVSTQMTESLRDFLIQARRDSDAQTSMIDEVKEKAPDLVYITSFPWGSYTGATNAVNIDPSDAIPRVSWGKFYMQGDRVMMPLTLRVHHGFVDGFHMGVFLEKLQVNMTQNLKM